jgi:hypothetical protein
MSIGYFGKYIDVEEGTRPSNQIPEIRATCRFCGYPVEVADGWLPY